MMSDWALADAALTAGFTVKEFSGGVSKWYASTGPGAPGLDLHDPLLISTVESWLRSMVGSRPDIHPRFYEESARLSSETVITGVAFGADDLAIARYMIALGRWDVPYARLVLQLPQRAMTEGSSPGHAPAA
jgi:hypothetical protein